MRRRGTGALVTVLAALLFAILLAPAAARAEDPLPYQGCDCPGYPANAKSISCFCRNVCRALTCPPGTSSPSFIESKSCPGGPGNPPHPVERTCCTGKTGATRCRPFPSCKKFSDS